MATTSHIRGIQSATLTGEGQDSITIRYFVKFDTATANAYEMLQLAQSATPHPVPQFGDEYTSLYPGSGSNKFVSAISPQPTPERKDAYLYDVTWSTPSVQDTGSFGPNPLLYPPKRDIDYIAIERPVTQARNVQELPHGDGKGGMRLAGTLGPIVNAAGKRPDEPFMSTTYNPVLTWEKNYAALEQIDALNIAFQETTNSDTIFSYEPKRLKYLVTQSTGEHEFNNITYWPAITRVEVLPTTDYIMDNVGYEYWDDTSGEWARHMVEDPERSKPGELKFIPSSEPANLKLDGDLGGDNTETITYEYLRPRPYLPLFGLGPP